jgi:hypothetical protein
VADVLAAKTAAALEDQPGLTALAVAGGVAANATLRAGWRQVAAEAGLPLLAPPLALCTDNAAMIAYAGLLSFEAGVTSDMTLPRGRAGRSTRRPRRWSGRARRAPRHDAAGHLRGGGLRRGAGRDLRTGGPG